ncbi:MAG TPA: DNA topoisomerase IV subunit A [Bacilli bacterium]|nr:DNA topoisomerase IV subunit A [Bacilli bacterium]
MAKKTKSIVQKVNSFVEEKILNENLDVIVGERFARYSKYIIQDRALPDVRDGLKPVQRRILFAMYKLGLFSNKPYKKSARIVGDVIGKYHPHGDTAVYEAMARLSQDFKMRLPLIDMHGNNGSIDGDSPAAMRYTEARLSKYAEAILQDINKKTVGFIPNFDDEEYEPTVLPSKYPNILVNGATGISAGYATDIPPHNIDEVINAVIYRMNNPECSLKEIMNIVKGPDFPTGGIVQGIEGIKSAYKNGRGKIIVKAKTEIIEEKNIYKLIITEIPYEVNKAVLVKRMSDVVELKNVDGIIDIRDESGRDGLRIVVDIKKDANPEYIRNFFFKSTDLQTNYNFNVVAIANKRPVQMGLLEILDFYIAHQREIVTNKSNYELHNAKKRLHIVEGLILMTSILDAVIKTIRSSANKRDAKENLISTYDFSEEQAEAIIMLQLYKLTNTDIFALQNEKEELKHSVEQLNDILSNETSLLSVIKSELLTTLAELSSPRRTQIEHKIEDVKVEVKELIAKEDAIILITRDGYIKRMTPKNYAVDEETKLKDNDIIIAKYDVTTLDTLLLFTNQGNYVYLPIQKIPDVKHKDLGRNVSTLASIAADEKIIFTVPIDDFNADRYVLFTTKNGLTKRTHIRDLIAERYSRALKATKIRENDELVSVDICDGDKNEVVMVTKKGFINRYNSNEISLFAPASFGVKALEMKSRPDDEVIGGYYVDSKDIILLLNQKGVIKKIKPLEIIKGKKNHVGRQYITLTKKSPAYLIDCAIVHKGNENLAEVDAYLEGSEGIVKFDLSGKSSIKTSEIGVPNKIIIARNSSDFAQK